MTIEDSRQAAARLAHEARRRQSAQQQVAETVAQVREQVASISPQAAETIGSALDSTQGFSFDPDARPNDLPAPGSAPGGEPVKRTGNMFAGMMPEAPPDAPARDVEPGRFGPPIPEQPRERQPAVKPGPRRRQHPVLSQLREDLGIDSIRPVDVAIGGHTWTLAALTPGDIATAARLADNLAIGRVETHMTYQTAVISHAVIAIDGVPTHEVFGVELPPGMAVDNPLRPSRSVRFHAAGKLFDFIQEEGKSTLGAKLFDAYMDKMDASGEVRSYLDEPGHKRVTYRCSHEGCEHELTIRPKYKPGTHDMVLPFCQWHGEPMEPVDEMEGETSPLL